MTDWNSLDGLELRRAVLELLGGYPDLKMRWFSNDAWTGEVLPNRANEKDMEYEEEVQWQELSFTKETEPKVAPRIESSADISECVLDEECKKRGFNWEVKDAIHRCGYVCLIWRMDSHALPIADGATPSLARARAIGILLERDQK